MNINNEHYLLKIQEKYQDINHLEMVLLMLHVVQFSEARSASSRLEIKCWGIWTAYEWSYQGINQIINHLEMVILDAA